MIRIVLLTMDGDVTSESLIIVKTLTKWLLFCILRTSSPELKKTFKNNKIKNSSEIQRNVFNICTYKDKKRFIKVYINYDCMKIILYRTITTASFHITLYRLDLLQRLEHITVN